MCNYAPTLKKLKRHIALGLSVLPFVRPLQKSSYIFEILQINLYQNCIVDPFFFVQIISLCGVTPLLKGHNEIL